MAAVLTPEERGPHAWWAYDSRDRLNLSDVQVAAALPGPRRGEKYNPATIRKAETQDRHMSRPLWKQLTKYYTERARTDGVALDPIPGGDPSDIAPPDQAALIKALADHTDAVNALVERLDSFVGPLGEVIADLLRDKVKEAKDRPRSGAANG